MDSTYQYIQRWGSILGLRVLTLSESGSKSLKTGQNRFKIAQTALKIALNSRFFRCQPTSRQCLGQISDKYVNILSILRGETGHALRGARINLYLEPHVAIAACRIPQTPLSCSSRRRPARHHSRPGDRIFDRPAGEVISRAHSTRLLSRWGCRGASVNTVQRKG